MMRHFGKQILTLVARWLGFTVLSGIAGLTLPAAAANSSLVSRIVTDPLTGVALGGMDPVSYFLGSEPARGGGEYQYDWAGVPWYFASAANRDIFMRAPEVYAPLYGGHGVMSLARGYLSDGNPHVFLIRGNRLLFFYSTGNRQAFRLSMVSAGDAAMTNWPDLSAGLSGPVDVWGQLPAPNQAVILEGK